MLIEILYVTSSTIIVLIEKLPDNVLVITRQSTRASHGSNQLKHTQISYTSYNSFI